MICHHPNDTLELSGFWTFVGKHWHTVWKCSVCGNKGKVTHFLINVIFPETL